MYEEQYDWQSVTTPWLFVLMTQLMPCFSFTHSDLHQSTAHFRRRNLTFSLLMTLTGMSVSAEDITEDMKSFPVGSAGGLHGVRPQHVKDMTSPYTGIVG
jgi:hypothetical protein